jgi:hypothetical protein
LIDAAGSMLAKRIRKLRYFRNFILDFLRRVRWISGATALVTKKETRP